jgi:uncharacterized protein (TIGR02246 family)
MDLWELVAREQIRETVASYAHAVDRGQFDRVVDLFTPSGVLEIVGDTTMRGRDEIRAFLTGVGRDIAETTSTRLIRHYTSNLTIDVVSQHEARAACYFLAVTEHGVDHWGRYRDQLAPHDGRWCFTQRSVRTDGRAPGSWAAHRP